jgi:HK97 family phage portal protein
VVSTALRLAGRAAADRLKRMPGGPPRRSWQDTGHWRVIHDPWPGAFQQDRQISLESIQRFSAVYACVDLIAGDISKLRPKVVSLRDGVWQELPQARRPVLRKPNRYQTRNQFFREWMRSKLYHGNTYALKERDERGAVMQMHILDPAGVEPMITSVGDVYYKLQRDWLAGIDPDDEMSLIIPASEIIHDRGLCLYHPMVGVSPIHAVTGSASLGVQITDSGAKFFGNAARPSGILTAPAHIADDTAERLRTHWETRFSGNNAGRVAVLGDGLTYEAMSMTAADSQQIEQLRWSIEDVARAYHVPAYKIGAGQPPTFNNISALNQDYYSQTLQTHIEDIESLLDDGLAFPIDEGVEFDLEGLLRMDASARADASQKGIGAGYLTPNEARARDGLPPVAGGETPYMQQQNWALAALADRPPPDQKPEPEAPNPEESEEIAAGNGDDEDEVDEEAAKALFARLDRIVLEAEYAE